MNRKAVFSTIVLTLSVAMLTGCTANTPEPTPTKTSSSKPAPTKTATPTPTPTPTSTPSPSVPPTQQPAPVPAPEPAPIKTTVVEIGADELRFENLGGKTLQSFSYEDTPVKAIAALTDLYGFEPKTEYTGNQVCYGELNIYKWDNMRISFYTSTQDPNQTDSFSAGTSEPNQNYERVIQAPNGVQVGFSYWDYVNKNPSLLHEESKAEYPYGSGKIQEWAKAIAEPTAKLLPDMNDRNASGSIYSGENGVVDSIGAPQYLYGDC